MRVLQTTLLTGPYDWDPAVLPKIEFAERLARVRAVLAARGASALLVYGEARDYGALAYLTGFVPKLGPALALVPREGDIRLLVTGTELMMPQAKRLTWVEDLRPFANVPKLVAEWAGTTEGAVATWALAALPHGIYRGIAGALAPRPLVPLDESLEALRRRKSPLEQTLLRGAARMLAAASDAFAASAQRGDGVRTAALAAERAAVAAGAQDARTLVNRRPGGAPLPIDGAEDPVLDPAIAAIAVQNAGYWAAGYLTETRTPRETVSRARDGLAAALAAARPGVTGAALLAAAGARLGPLAPHPMTAAAIGHAIGLSLEEGPIGALESGAAYLLAVGAEGAGDAAIVSALIAMNDGGPEVLWEAR